MTQDIIELLRNDHGRIEELSWALTERPPGERDELFRRLVTEIVRHEAAEKAVVHPMVREHEDAGRQTAAALLEDESELERRLAALERLDPATTAFLEQFRLLRARMLGHLRQEEADELPRLRELLSERQRRELGQSFLTAKERAPTHPHPGTPHGAGFHTVGGPLAGAIDRLREAVRHLAGS